MTDEIITFTRKRDLRFIRELGQGACGRTVLLHDDIIDEDFVCKKYSPMYPSMQKELFASFIREIKLLHLLNHPNIVRVFNYHLYPEKVTGYILMECVSGTDIHDHIVSHPEDANSIFLGVLDGFEHLEKCGILHRDIRPQNIMVTSDGVAKIIDFGFGKQAASLGDFERSISLNLWCERPAEFALARYDHSTDLYFVGKLFEMILEEAGVTQFGYRNALHQMCQRDPGKRAQSFRQVRQDILAGKIADIAFTDDELSAYRNLATSLSAIVARIEKGTKYHSIDDVERRLEALAQKTMLEEIAPSNQSVVNCFLGGSYYLAKTPQVRTAHIRAFLNLLRTSGRDRKEVVVKNLHARLDSIERYEEEQLSFDDIPF